MMTKTTNSYLFLLAFILFSFFSSRATAQNIVVEAAAIDEDQIEPSRTAQVILIEKNDLKKAQTVADFLKEVPGIEVVKQGGIGQTTSIFIRGARSEDTLVLIDGVEVNDAISPSQGFDFSVLSPENIERIEIYRGPQSVRFGAGALGGVISIITKEGKEVTQREFFTELGTEETHREMITFSGKTKTLSFAAAASHLSTRGFSAASKNSGNTEADGANIASASTKLTWAASPQKKIEMSFRYANAAIELDSHGGRGGDDPNSNTKSKQWVGAIRGSQRFFNEQIKTSLGVYFSKIDRRSRNQPDPQNITDSSDNFLSENRKIQSETEWWLGEHHTLRIGISYREESGLSDSLLNGTSTFFPTKMHSVAGGSLTYLFENPILFFDLGLRADQSSKVGYVPSFRASFGRFLNRDTKAFVTYGTGYKLPSLYQLYSNYGDQNLKQENSTALEATVEHHLTADSVISITTFENRFSDMIDYDNITNHYFNISKSSSRGFEIQSLFKLANELKLSTSYIYLKTKDEGTGLDLLRRAQHVWKLSLQYSKESYNLYFENSYHGEREDIDPNDFQRLKMSSYSVASVGASFDLKSGFKIHLRTDNVLDQVYEDVAGYGTPARSVFAGLAGDF